MQPPLADSSAPEGSKDLNTAFEGRFPKGICIWLSDAAMLIFKGRTFSFDTGLFGCLGNPLKEGGRLCCVRQRSKDVVPRKTRKMHTGWWL